MYIPCFTKKPRLLDGLMVCVWHLRAHQYEGSSELVLSLDMLKHMANLPPQEDVLDAFLEQPRPLPEPPAPSPPPPRSPMAPEGTADNAFGDLAALLVPRPESPDDCVKMPLRKHHTLLTDALIFQFVKVHGPRWRALARSLGGRAAGYSDDVVRNRYVRIMEALGKPYVSPTPHPNARRPTHPCSRWTVEEDAAVRRRVNGKGTPWAEVQRDLDIPRTAQAIRNRAHRLGIV